MCINYDKINHHISISFLPFEEPETSFTEKEVDALNDQIPMTQELYDNIFDKCIAIGQDSHIILGILLRDWRYRKFLTARSDKIAEMMGDYDEA